MSKKRLGTARQYDDLALLARIIRDSAEDLYKLALEVGEIGTANTAEDTRKDFARIAAVMSVRVDEARLADGTSDGTSGIRPEYIPGTWDMLDSLTIRPNETPDVLTAIELERAR